MTSFVQRFHRKQDVVANKSVGPPLREHGNFSNIQSTNNDQAGADSAILRQKTNTVFG